MKLKLAIVILLALFFSTALAQTVNAGTEAETTTDELPEFPGGVVKMMDYVKANIKYPKRALEEKITGKCNLKFTVNPDGSISDIIVLDRVANCPECDEEAIRVVKSMPKWKPGKLAGKAVALFYNLPVSFKLPKK